MYWYVCVLDGRFSQGMSVCNEFFLMQVLNAGGNLLDAVSVAVRAALKDTMYVLRSLFVEGRRLILGLCYCID
jgi:exosome complex RNA-binding protein Rrp42 (RNase PH superfamily)